MIGSYSEKIIQVTTTSVCPSWRRKKICNWGLFGGVFEEKPYSILHYYDKGDDVSGMVFGTLMLWKEPARRERRRKED